jgi:hypothetical protein
MKEFLSPKVLPSLYSFVNQLKSIKQEIEVKAMKNEEKNDLAKEEDEKRILLELIKMQNEALKRLYKNTINKETED